MVEKGKKSTVNRALTVRLSQLVLLILVLGCWQILPQLSVLQSISHVFDVFFVSSPLRVAHAMNNLFTGSNGSVLIWPFLWNTVFSSLIGTIVGMFLGALCGLLLSNFSFASDVLRPFIVAANATPRVALVPIIVLLWGPTLLASTIVAVLVVFFVAFFNAYEGGTTVRPELVQNAQLLGGSEWRVLRYIRFPYVMAWTMAALPLAVTFAVISVVTGEILTGSQGMGALLQTAAMTGDSSLTFAVVIVLAAVGLTIVMGADQLRGRILHWWGK